MHYKIVLSFMEDFAELEVLNWKCDNNYQQQQILRIIGCC